MYPSWISVVMLNICRIVFASIAFAFFMLAGFGMYGRYLIGFLVSFIIACMAHAGFSGKLTFPSTELGGSKDAFLAVLARQLPKSSAREKVYIRIPMKCLRGKPCKPRDVTVMMADTEWDYDFHSEIAWRRYQVKENGQSYSLEYCDLDGQFSIPLPRAGVR